MQSKKQLPIHNKIIIIGSVWIILAVFILSNAFRLQLLEGQKFLRQASAINRAVDRIVAPRGLIYDAKGRLLVNNDPQFSLYVLPAELDQSKLDSLWEELSVMFGVAKEDLAKTYERKAFTVEKKLVGERVTLISNLTYDNFLQYATPIAEKSGVYITSEPSRTYNDSTIMAHILGYLGDVNAKEVETLGLDPRARVGKEGIEKTFDADLRGEDGKSIRESTIGEESTRSWVAADSRAGNNIYLTIDHDWQQTLYNYLAKYTASQEYALGGAGIIMEAKTGNIKAMANYPTYDANLFARGISNQDFQNLLNDERSPLLNRAVAMQIPTGSIFKIFMAGPLLEEKVISPSTVYKSGKYELPGGYVLYEADKKDLGNVNLVQAIAKSSNTYFCQASVAMAGKLGDDDAAIRKLDSYFEQLGLGKLSEVGLPGEQPGSIPSPELKQKIQKEPWYLADLCNTAIGQGLVTATPIQMAVATAAIVNGGNVLYPQLVAKMEDADLNTIIPEQGKVKSKLEVGPSNLNIIKEGMQQAVEYGSAKGLSDTPGNPIAKTGSSEAGKQKIPGQNKYVDLAHSWVVGSFSYNGVDYVFVVAMQFGGRGFRSVPVVVDFIDCLYKEFNNCKG